MKKKSILFGAAALLLVLIGYYVWDSKAHPMLTEARHYASSYTNMNDPRDRCAYADLAAAYYRWGDDQPKFEEWKTKAQAHCPSNFPHAYYLDAPVQAK